MLGRNLIRNSLTYLRPIVPNQRWVSGIAATNQLEAKTLQETALAENCILVDEFDRAIGQSSKRDCHRVDEHGQIKLHRAFSVFLFNSNGEMLIQKRSSHKVLLFFGWSFFSFVVIICIILFLISFNFNSYLNLFVFALCACVVVFVFFSFHLLFRLT